MLERFHISYLRRILGLHWWDKVPHAEVYQRVNSFSMEVLLTARQLRWTGHVTRMPTNRFSLSVCCTGNLKRETAHPVANTSVSKII